MLIHPGRIQQAEKMLREAGYGDDSTDLLGMVALAISRAKAHQGEIELAAKKQLEEHGLTLEADRYKIRAGTLEVDVDALGIGTIKLNGEPMRGLTELTVYIEADEPVRVRAEMFPVEAIPTRRPGYRAEIGSGQSSSWRDRDPLL